MRSVNNPPDSDCHYYKHTERNEPFFPKKIFLTTLIKLVICPIRTFKRLYSFLHSFNTFFLEIFRRKELKSEL